MKEAKMGLWDPLRWPGRTTKDGGVATVVMQQGRFFPCRCVWGVVGSTEKIAKIY